MEPKSALCIAMGLKHTSSLKFIDVSGNPIGQFGMRLLMQSMNSNSITSFKMNIKNISAENERQMDSSSEKDSALNFDPMNPERKYELDLSQSYHQICL